MRQVFSTRIAFGLLLFTTALPSGAVSRGTTGNSVAADTGTAHKIIDVGLASGNPNIRVEAIAATGMIAKSPSVRKQIEASLTDKNVDVRIAASDALADLGFEQSAPALEKVLNTDPVPEVEFAAAKALYKLNDPKGKQVLEEVLYRKIDSQSSYITRQRRQLVSHFHSVHDVTIFMLSTSGGFVPVPGAGLGLSEIARLMDDSELSPRATIVLMLGRQRDADTDKLLLFALKDKDWTVRASAVLMIALTAREKLRQDLVPLMNDSDSRVRFRAAGAYLHLINAQAAPHGE